MLYLNNKALNIQGIIDLFNQEVLGREEPKSPPPSLIDSSDPRSLINQFRKKLQGVYFPNKKLDEITPELIIEDSRFLSYPNLKHGLAVIFNPKNVPANVKDTINTQLAKITDTDLMPLDAREQWLKLNQELGYFENDAVLPLFTEVARACRSMSVLIEENLAGEKMPYIYAYRLMALFATQTPTPSFDEIAKKTYALLNQANVKKNDKLYHDVILNQIQLPPRDRVASH